MANPVGVLEVPGLTLPPAAGAPRAPAAMPQSMPGPVGSESLQFAPELPIPPQSYDPLLGSVGQAPVGYLGGGQKPAADPFGLFASQQPGPAMPAAPQRQAAPVQEPQPQAQVQPQAQPRAVGGMPAARAPSSLDYQAAMMGAGLESEAVAADVAQRQARLTGIYEQRMAEENKRAEEQRQAAQAILERQRAQYEADQKARLSEIDALKTDIAATKIDPENYFSKQPVWAKVLSLLSVGLGGFASGWSGGRLRNTALDMMNDAIARDIDAQKANLASKRASLADRQSLYAQARQKFGDDQSAYMFTAAQQTEAVANAARRYGAEARSVEMRLNAEKLAGQLDARAKQLYLGIGQMYAQDQERQRAAAAGAMAAQERARQQAIDKQLEREAKVAGIGKTRAETEALMAKAAGVSAEDYSIVNFTGPTTEPGVRAPQPYAVPKEFAKPAQEVAASSAAFNRAINAAVSASSQPTFRVPGSTASRDFQAAIGLARGPLAKMLAGGYNPTAIHEEQAASILSDKPWLTGAQWDASVRNTAGLVEQQARENLLAAGARPVAIGEQPGTMRRSIVPAGESAPRPIRTFTSGGK